MKEDLLKIINTYGAIEQLKYFQSEVFELNEAILEYRYDENKIYPEVEQCLKKHIAEEIADVLVMLNQFKEYYDISDDEINKIMTEKIDRQLERIRNKEINERIIDNIVNGGVKGEDN